MSGFPSCPLPLEEYPTITMAHGGGGAIMRRLIERMFFAAFDRGELAGGPDAAVLALAGGELALTTDAFVVSPRFFPGGDIGSLSVHGTVNDLAMVGAEPIALAVAFVLEEGLPTQELWSIVSSMAAAAEECGVRIVTGDTKVVERGHGDGVFVATTGVGRVVSRWPVHPERIRPGDVVLVSGDVGRHGMAVLVARGNLGIASDLESDSAAVHPAALALLREGIEVRAMRDPTRGGLASALNELAAAARVGFEIRETDVPVDPRTAAIAELAGLDPLYSACEGRFLAVVPQEQSERALAVLRQHPVSAGAALIGTATADAPRVVVRTAFGTRRLLPLLSGEQLPRIC
ncbi:MAG: hydrogenase expression/formation protein HypE [Fimbriimonadales bacterium]|nr:hydrogenase expression/formation protein HypE [Fimbriimonadales bacterium]